MLELKMTCIGAEVALRRASPMAYLDHWALRKFASDANLASRLTAVLHRRGGTLALSWLNLGEYATVSDPEQHREAEQFVEGMLPAIFCLDTNLAAVDKRERAGDPLPHAHLALARMFVSTGGQGVKPFTATGLFERLYDVGLARTKDKLAATVQGRLEYLRQTHSENGVFREAVRRADRAPYVQATTRTRAIVRTLAATFFPDLKKAITPNDAIDFLHAAIPVTYCDAVLLDGGTADRVERARRRLSSAGIKVADVFSGRRDGVDRFLAHLEGT